MPQRNLQPSKYLAALKQKQNGTLPEIEEELWRHCCSDYHTDDPICDLCKPRTDGETTAIKDLQPENYVIALKQKLNGTLPRFEEELWRHCCADYHTGDPICDLCKPRTDEERIAIKDEINSTDFIEWKRNTVKEQSDRKRKANDSGINPSDIKRKKNTERVASYRKSLSPAAKDRTKQKNKEQHRLQRHSLSPDAKEAIKQKDKEQHRLQRQSLTSEAKDKIKEKDKQQHALKQLRERKLLKAKKKICGTKF